MRLGVTIFAVVCAGPLPRASAQPASAEADSAAIVRAVWEAAFAEAGPPRAGVVRWLWAPGTADTARVVPLSAALRGALVRRGVPASERRPAGDDTVVVRLTGWRADGAGVMVELVSGWSVVLRSGARRCRTGSGNVERFSVRRVGATWVALREGPVVHGDRVCTPMP